MMRCDVDITKQATSCEAHRSALVGFLERLPDGARYAVYPGGRYTRACLADTTQEDRCFRGMTMVGIVDDAAEGQHSIAAYPVASLDDVLASWKLDAVLLLRDTNDRALSRNINAARVRGLLRGVQVVDQPAPRIEAMATHLGSYAPTNRYEPVFAEHCQSRTDIIADVRFDSPRLIMTLDAEVFAAAHPQMCKLYPTVMRAFGEMLRDRGYSASLCVQLQSDGGDFAATPADVVEDWMDMFGEESIELHGLNHIMPVEGYGVDWFEEALELMHLRYGAYPHYWAPPGWTVNWRTLRVLQHVPAIRAMRGFWSGCNRMVGEQEEMDTFRSPYSCGGLWHFPYSYVDFFLQDYQSKQLPWENIERGHARCASAIADTRSIIETVVHPFRLVVENWREGLQIVARCLDQYAQRGVRIVHAREITQSLGPGVLRKQCSPQNGVLS